MNDDTEVARWKEAYSPLCAAFMGFYVANGVEWLLGGTHYMYKLIVNCDRGVLFDDVTSIKPHEGFIWCDVKVSPCGTKLAAMGCVWAFPYQAFVYDLSPLEDTGKIVVPDTDMSEEEFEQWQGDAPGFASPDTDAD